MTTDPLAPRVHPLPHMPNTTETENAMTTERTMTDSEALDQIAGFLGLYTTDPSNNPVESLINDIIGITQQTGRATNVGEGA